MKINMWLVLILLSSSVGFAEEYRKAVETRDNVKNKRYPKKGKIELNINGGGIINQSFTDTFSIHGSLNYFFSEAWGLGIDFMKNFNSDRGERACIENFMLRATDVVVSPECLTDGGDLSQDGSLARAKEIQEAAANNPANQGVLNANRITAGPAYVPIREKEMTIGLNLVWNPVYGKQLFFGIGWFDLFVNMGVGVAFNTYYPKKDSYNIGQGEVQYRGPYSDDENDPLPGVDVTGLENNQDDRDLFGSLVGTGGRPTPVDEVGAYILLGVGQRYHFAKYFHVNIELRNYTHLGVEGFFDNYFTLMGGVGFRI